MTSALLENPHKIPCAEARPARPVGRCTPPPALAPGQSMFARAQGDGWRVLAEVGTGDSRIFDEDAMRAVLRGEPAP